MSQTYVCPINEFNSVTQLASLWLFLLTTGAGERSKASLSTIPYFSGLTPIFVEKTFQLSLVS